MAIFHVATNTPPKAEIIARWVCEQPWGPPEGSKVELVGSFHLDDPDGQVGMQVFVVEAAGDLLQIPLSYRAAALPDADDAFIATMEHSVLGTRYIYDGLRDARFVVVYAGVAACGYGQALGFAEHEGRWYVMSDEIHVHSVGALGGRFAVDNFVMQTANDAQVVLTNDQLELTFFRQLASGAPATAGLTATWTGRTDPVTLAQINNLET